MAETIIHYEIPTRINHKDKCIQMLWMEKWRGVRYWPYAHKPSQKIINEAIETFKTNCGKTYRPVKMTFVWQESVNP